MRDGCDDRCGLLHDLPQRWQIAFDVRFGIFTRVAMPLFEIIVAKSPFVVVDERKVEPAVFRVKVNIDKQSGRHAPAKTDFIES